MLQHGDGDHRVEAGVLERQLLAHADHVGGVVVGDLEVDDTWEIHPSPPGAAVQHQPGVADLVDQGQGVFVIAVGGDLGRGRHAGGGAQVVAEKVRLAAGDAAGQVVPQQGRELFQLLRAQNRHLSGEIQRVGGNP